MNVIAPSITAIVARPASGASETSNAQTQPMRNGTTAIIAAQPTMCRKVIVLRSVKVEAIRCAEFRPG